MKVEQLMARPVHSCRQDDSLAQAAHLMWEYDCGCLPVCVTDGSGQVIGVITDRDICMCALFQGRPLGAIRVSEAMARSVHVCRPKDSLADVEANMREARIRRLPVVDEQGRLMGMISLADLAHEAKVESRSDRKEITETEVGATLATICEPLHKQLAA